GARLLHIQLRVPQDAVLTLWLVGIVWSVVYVVFALKVSRDWAEMLLAPLAGWALTFEGDFIQGLLIAVPTNVLLGWGLAYGGAPLAARFLNAGYDLAFYAIFGVVSLVAISVCVWIGHGLASV